jgi:hypothetical protein
MHSIFGLTGQATQRSAFANPPCGFLEIPDKRLISRAGYGPESVGLRSGVEPTPDDGERADEGAISADPTVLSAQHLRTIDVRRMALKQRWVSL